MGKKQSKQVNYENINDVILPPSQSPNYINIPIQIDHNDAKFKFIGNHTFLIPTVKFQDAFRKVEYRDEWIPLEFIISGSDQSDQVMSFGHSDSLIVIATGKFF